MSKHTAELLDAYNALPIAEQQEFVGVLRRAAKGKKSALASMVTPHPDAGPFELLAHYSHEEDEDFESPEWGEGFEVDDDNILAIDLVSLVPLVAHAIAVFGDEDKASHWLTTPVRLFHNFSPAEILERGGLGLVEQTLTRIEHNIPS